VRAEPTDDAHGLARMGVVATDGRRADPGVHRGLTSAVEATIALLVAVLGLLATKACDTRPGAAMCTEAGGAAYVGVLAVAAGIVVAGAVRAVVRPGRTRRWYRLLGVLAFALALAFGAT
jgi:hypothetical protein